MAKVSGNRYSNKGVVFGAAPFNPQEAQEAEERHQARVKSDKRADRRDWYDRANWRHNKTSRLIDRLIVLDGAERKKAGAKGRPVPEPRPLSRRQQRLFDQLKLVRASELYPRRK